jgi:hypothetical protein
MPNYGKMDLDELCARLDKNTARIEQYEARLQEFKSEGRALIQELHKRGFNYIP